MVRRKFISFMLASIIAVTTVFSAGCGFVTDLKLALASSGPLVQLLVSKGLISQEKADFIRTDFGDAVTVVGDLDADLKTALNTHDKLVAAQKAQRAWTAIYARGHFGTNPAILDAANIADSIFATIVAYYGGTNSVSRVPKSDTDLADLIKAKTRALKEKLKVQ